MNGLKSDDLTEIQILIIFESSWSINNHYEKRAIEIEGVDLIPDIVY